MSDSYHAWYSAENDRVWGVAIYLNEEGKEVRCSMVDKDKDVGEEWCKYWKDKRYVGVVIEFVRSESKDPFSLDKLMYHYGIVDEHDV